MNKLFQIGSFCFCLRYEKPIVPPANFMLFKINEGIPSYTYDIITVERLPKPEGILAARRADMLVFQNQELESRLIGTKGIRGVVCFLSGDFPESCKNNGGQGTY